MVDELLNPRIRQSLSYIGAMNSSKVTVSMLVLGLVPLLYLLCSHVQQSVADGNIPAELEKVLLESRRSDRAKKEAVIPNITRNLLKESYEEWAQWKNRYPYCNPDNNRDQSPISVHDEEVLSDSDKNPLLVHTGSPIDDCFYLSVVHKQPNFEMEAANIFVHPSCRKQASFISRLGSSPRRRWIFKRAFLLLTKSGVESQRSLHVIDEAGEHQMEFALQFSHENGTDFIQIFIPVQASPPGEISDNPVLKPIELAIAKLKKKLVDDASGQSNSSKNVRHTQQNCEDAETHYKDLLEKQKTEMPNSTYMQRVQELQHLASSLQGLTNAKLKNISETSKMSGAPVPKAAKKDKADDIEKLIKKEFEIHQVLDEQKDLGIAESPADKMLNDEIREIDYEIQNIEQNDSSLAIPLASEDLSNASKGLDISSSRLADLLLSHKIGLPGEKSEGVLFDGPDAIYEELDKFKKKDKELSDAKKNYTSVCAQFEKLQMLPHGYVKISSPFQISWLFPSSGGYYRYDGSLPIPPCTKAYETLVFESPLRITTEQLAVLQSIPSLRALSKASSSSIDPAASDFADNYGVDKMIPILHESSERRKVWRVTRDTFFIGDDGFRSRTPWKVIREALQSKSPRKPLVLPSLFILLAVLNCFAAGFIVKVGIDKDHFYNYWS